jgi:hypothetical protein
LEGARKAGGTKTYSGAPVKQKTAVPQGAASLWLAVLESDGRKGNWRQTVWRIERGTCRVKTKATGVGLSDDCQTDGVRNERVQYSNNATFLVRRRKRVSGSVDVDRENVSKAVHFCLEGEPQVEFDLPRRA